MGTSSTLGCTDNEGTQHSTRDDTARHGTENGTQRGTGTEHKYCASRRRATPEQPIRPQDRKEEGIAGGSMDPPQEPRRVSSGDKATLLKGNPGFGPGLLIQLFAVNLFCERPFTYLPPGDPCGRS